MTAAPQLLQVCPLSTNDELIEARQAVKLHAADMKFSPVNQTKLITVTSELGRNAMLHGLGGTLCIDLVSSGSKVGMRLTFQDAGPGIEDIELALTDGYTTKNGLGLGLSGSKRLMDDFTIKSEVQVGTTVCVIKWK
ncbi:MAG TPA: anti-sigma regulatory factor [Chroococcales cyanobacterium]